MRNVERQARALKLALEAATDIQANPSWEYAHIVTRIQESILDMDGQDVVMAMPISSLPQYKPVMAMSHGYSMSLSDGKTPWVALVVPGGVQHGIPVTGNFDVLQALRKSLIDNTGLEKFGVVTCEDGIRVTQETESLPHVPVESSATISFKEGSYAGSIAMSFFTHVFRDTYTIGTAQ